MLKNNVVRKEGWEKRFTKYVESVANRPFKRGEHDCTIFVALCVREITGHDLSKEFFKAYKNKEQAWKILNELGCEDLCDLACLYAGEAHENVKFAKRGDIVLLKHETEGYSLGVVDLSGRQAVTTGKESLVFYPRKEWLKAWEV